MNDAGQVVQEGEGGRADGETRDRLSLMSEMTSKEQLRERIEGLSEVQAERTLRLLDDLDDDPVIAAFRDAPEDDEPLTPAEEQAIEQARAEHRRGESVALDDIRHEFS